MELVINQQPHTIPQSWRNESLLHVLREHLGLVGAKFGCGVGLCGACTVIIDGKAERACITAVRDAVGSKVRTIEGLASDGARLHPVQQAWLDEAVPQCGYCQAGQIMTAVALLERTPKPNDAQIDAAMDDNLCRCGTYQRIRKAIKLAAARGPR